MYLGGGGAPAGTRGRDLGAIFFSFNIYLLKNSYLHTVYLDHTFPPTLPTNAPQNPSLIINISFPILWPQFKLIIYLLTH